jgi:hypothetical protein
MKHEDCGRHHLRELHGAPATAAPGQSAIELHTPAAGRTLSNAGHHNSDELQEMGVTCGEALARERVNSTSPLPDLATFFKPNEYPTIP